MKTFGESTYKGYIMLKDKKDPTKYNKHYISAVDKTFGSGNKVIISVRGERGDMVFDYTPGTIKRVDIGISTWRNERRKRGMRF